MWNDENTNNVDNSNDHRNALGYAYLDRLCYRLPTTLSEEIGQAAASAKNMSAKKRKKATLQRSLTPHLDCCPDTYDTATGKSKWRPIQCLVSLTDNLEPDTGGLEVAPGFHHEFRSWTNTRAPTVAKEGSPMPAPCLGEYTHMRPTEDATVMQRVQHVPGVCAGSAVFWDNRLPHANAYRHNGTEPRAVVYASFLPPIALNRAYAERQLQLWKQGKNPTDQWINPNTTLPENDTPTELESEQLVRESLARLPTLSQQLLGAKEW